MTIVYDMAGHEFVTIEGEFRDHVSGRERAIPVAVAAYQPDLFELVDPAHPTRGCVRRGIASLSGDPSRSAP